MLTLSHYPASCTSPSSRQPSAKASQAAAHLESVQRALAGAQQQLPPLQQALEKEHKRVSPFYSLKGVLGAPCGGWTCMAVLCCC